MGSQWTQHELDQDCLAHYLQVQDSHVHEYMKASTHRSIHWSLRSVLRLSQWMCELRVWVLLEPMGGWEGWSLLTAWPNRAGCDVEEGGGENRLVPSVWPTHKNRNVQSTIVSKRHSVTSEDWMPRIARNSIVLCKLWLKTIDFLPKIYWIL